MVPAVAELATTQTGSGPAVLLLHGLNGFKEGWGRLPGALAGAGMRAVAVDLPGFGATPALRGRMTPEAVSRAVAPLAAALAPVALVGHSLGAQAALLLAAAEATVVTRVVLLAPWALARPLRLPPRGIADVVRLPVVGPALARLGIARMRRDPARRRQAFLSAVGDPARVASDPEASALLDEAADRLLRADLRAMSGWASAGLRADLRAIAPRVAQPALVVHGALDRVVGRPGADWLAEALPHGRLLLVKGAGHFPHLEEPGVVVPAIVGHLA
jgi:3-oxoadipate enol-lactonase